MSSNIAVGIDLGTTYSCVGVFQHGKVEIIANDQGNRTTPSYVAFTDTERLIGDAAKNQVAMNPSNTVFGRERYGFVLFYCCNALLSSRCHFSFSLSACRHVSLFRLSSFVLFQMRNDLLDENSTSHQ